MHDEFSVQISAVPARVYSLLVQPERLLQWLDTDSLDFEFRYTGQTKVGDRVIMTPRLRLSQGWRMVGQTIELVPEERVVHRFVEGPLFGTESWVLASCRTGCIMRKVIDYEVRGWLKSFIWQINGRRLHAKGCQKELQRLKHLAETQEAG